jgi:hypothetical protein
MAVAYFKVHAPRGFFPLVTGGEAEVFYYFAFLNRPIWPRFPCISLKVGAERQQVSETPVLDVLPSDPDWDDTAALVAVLRCVVTVDTGTAHLAGALGARTLVAPHGLPNLRWMTDTPPWQVRGPWYPSATLYRRRAGTWGDVVARIVADLEA